jgi:hypothetical protein
VQQITPNSLRKGTLKVRGSVPPAENSQWFIALHVLVVVGVGRWQNSIKWLFLCKVQWNVSQMKPFKEALNAQHGVELGWIDYRLRETVHPFLRRLNLWTENGNGRVSGKCEAPRSMSG